MHEKYLIFFFQPQTRNISKYFWEKFRTVLVWIHRYQCMGEIFKISYKYISTNLSIFFNKAYSHICNKIKAY